MKSSYFYIVLIVTGMMFHSCTKKSELDALPYNNFIPGDTTQFFVVDSIRGNPFPYIKLYYHIRYDQIAHPSEISKIIIYRDGIQKFVLSPAQPNVYSPTDMNVWRFTNYTYTFAFQDANGKLSRFSRNYPFYLN